jgi:predicted kinase
MGNARLVARLRSQFGWSAPSPPGDRPALLLLSGLPGTGKSYLAATIAARHAVAVVRSDEVRKVLFSQPTYAATESASVYRTCYALLDALLRDRYRVVFDATNLLRQGRQDVAAIAAGAGAPMLTLVTEAPPDIVAARLQRRASGASEPFSSDADWSVYEKLALSAEPVTEEGRLIVDTSKNVAPALAAIDGLLGVSSPAGGVT